jgi:hypothetical protein
LRNDAGGMTVLIETPSTQRELTAELAWCLQRFVSGRADETAMRRAEHALALWEAWLEEDTIDLAGT